MFKRIEIILKNKTQTFFVREGKNVSCFWRSHCSNLQDKMITTLTGSAAQLASSWQTKICQWEDQYICTLLGWQPIIAQGIDSTTSTSWNTPMPYNLPFFMLKADLSQCVIQHIRIEYTIELRQFYCKIHLIYWITYIYTCTAYVVWWLLS